MKYGFKINLDEKKYERNYSNEHTCDKMLICNHKDCLDPCLDFLGNCLKETEEEILKQFQNKCEKD